MTQIRTAMVLAAGVGSRLRPLTDETPKPLINVGGQPVILRTLGMLAAVGIERVVINTHYMAPMLERAVMAGLGKAAPAGLAVHFSREETLMETGGGIKKALPLLGDKPFLVVNSDAVWREDVPLLRPLMEAFNMAKHDALLAVIPKATAKEFQPLGDFKFEKRGGKLVRNGKRELYNVIYAGVHVTHPGLFAAAGNGPFSLNVVWKDARERGRLQGFLYEGAWADMGTHTGLAVARKL